MNCRALPEIFSKVSCSATKRLFYRCRGMRRGIFEMANRGLFLDEVGSQSFDSVKLLRPGNRWFYGSAEKTD